MFCNGVRRVPGRFDSLFAAMVHTTFQEVKTFLISGYCLPFAPVLKSVGRKGIHWFIWQDYQSVPQRRAQPNDVFAIFHKPWIRWEHLNDEWDITLIIVRLVFNICKCTFHLAEEIMMKSWEMDMKESLWLQFPFKNLMFVHMKSVISVWFCIMMPCRLYQRSISYSLLRNNIPFLKPFNQNIRSIRCNEPVFVVCSYSWCV